LAKTLLNDPAEVSVAAKNATTELVKQSAHFVNKSTKRALLTHLFRTNKWDQVLVFTRTKHGANRLVEQLGDDGIRAEAFHGNKSQSARTKALTNFKNGKVRALVATDIAARGIDIHQLPQVVNFDLPLVAEDYVHRIGRTGRAGSNGHAVSLVGVDELKLLTAIEKLIKKDIDVVEVDDYTGHTDSPAPAAPRKKRGGRGSSKKRASSKKKSFGKRKPDGQGRSDDKSRGKSKARSKSRFSGQSKKKTGTAGNSQRKQKQNRKPRSSAA